MASFKSILVAAGMMTVFSLQAEVLSNGMMTVVTSAADGCVESLTLAEDPCGMNWVEGCSRWGTLLGYRPDIDWSSGADDYFRMVPFYPEGQVDCDGGQAWRWWNGAVEATVSRSMEEDGLHETYTFRNSGPAPVYFNRGQLGIVCCFNDDYTRADVSETMRCNAHVWCGGESSYIHALKQGPFGTELALILTEGSIDGYSVRRVGARLSNDRGDIVLHPSPFVLKGGEQRSISWVVTSFPEGGFRDARLRYPNQLDIRFRQETVYRGEAFRIEAQSGAPISSAKVLCNGRRLPCRVKGNRVIVRHRAFRCGEARFEFIIDGHRSSAVGNVTLKPEKLASRRVRFIVRHQQCLDPESPLYGAYLIYDNETGCRYFDNRWSDHNASRERLGMGLLLCRWLQTHRSAEVSRSLDLFEDFVTREFFDTESGAVFNTIGKDPEYKRLYNAPWMVCFWQEMFRLKGDRKYLDWMERCLLDYYRGGGASFYPNGSTFSDAICLLEENGHSVGELKAALRAHVGNILANGIVYPPHEVNFEQTIVSPAVAILAGYYSRIEASDEVLEALGQHIGILKRFQGDQPSFHCNEIPIRHWDGYWFGKDHMYGDTQHYWSVLSARAFAMYSEITGDRALAERAEKCMRNSLASFFPDGSASCAWYQPYSVTMLYPDGSPMEGFRRGEHYDPWANDQDFGLYFILDAVKDKKQ